MTGTRTLSRSVARRLLICVGLLAAISFSARSAHAVVKFFDGFGDADINNNGTPLEAADVDVNNNTTIGTYTPARASNSALATNPEVNSVLNASDVGLRWLSNAGFTSSNTGDPKAFVRIVDDTQGSMQETKTVANGGLGVTAINNGYAMSWNSKGRGSTAAAFFDQNIALGHTVGDQVKVSFDYRIWRDAPNANTVEAPADALLRFGLYQDTDHQLGMTNPSAGRDVGGVMQPAVWGQQDGWFEGTRASLGGNNAIGSPGDAGWFSQVTIEDPNGGILKPPLQNGGNWRIREESNIGTGSNDVRVLQGTTDVDTVAVPHEATPMAQDYGLVNLDINKVYNLSMTLQRATSEVTGDTITATLTATDRATGISYTLSGTEPAHSSTGQPDGILSDNWDYFVIGSPSTTDDYDMIIDNFKLEVLGSNAGVPGDYNNDGTVNAADYVLWRKGGTLANEVADVGTISAADYAEWRARFGNTSGSGTSLGGSAVPEPGSPLLLLIGGLLVAGTQRRV
jgi:hypothetical protein